MTAKMTSEPDLIPYRSPRAASDRTAVLGMIVFMAAWAMMFASLFFAYGVVRASAPEWPPADLPRLPTNLPTLSTLVLVASSATFHGALVAVRRRRERLAGPLVLGTLVLGSAFVFLQWTLWKGLWQAGLRPQTGTYASAIYGLTAVHAAHVGVGIGALAWLSVRALRGAYTAPVHLPLRLWGHYWHFVGVVWLIMYTTMFLV